MKYGGGRPKKNTWKDKLSHLRAGDAVYAAWQYVPAGWFPERQACDKWYLILDKKINWHDDQGVDWRCLDLVTGKVIKSLWLNDSIEKEHVILTKLTGEELAAKLAEMPKTEENKEWWPK